MAAARCRVEMLGGMRLWVDGEETNRFRTHKVALLLAYLALHRGQAHGRERLIELLWPESDLQGGRDSLNHALSSLRRQLEPPGGGVPAGALLIADRSTARLNPELVSTDVADFERHLAVALRAAPGDPARRTALEQAVALYQGEFLPGRYEAWVVSEQERLGERHREAMRLLVGELERAGEIEAGIDVARRALAADPCDEEVCRALMRLHAARGNAAAALEAYQSLEAALEENVGGRPDSATRTLADLLRRDPAALGRKGGGAAVSVAPPAAQATVAPTATPAAPAANSGGATLTTATPLPLQITRFLGRDAELNALVERLQPLVTDGDGGPRLVTVTGPGGMGKTRIAVEAAHRLARAYDGRVFFATLADAPDGGTAVRAVLHAFRVKEPAGGGDPAEAVASAVGAGAPALLVLDNFEHVLPPDGEESEIADFVGRVLALLPRARCLATSRRLLLIGGEQEFPLEPLPLPGADAVGALRGNPAVALYADRAALALPDWKLNAGNAGDVAALCRRLEGIPLAIEMAASWVKAMAPARMRERLDTVLDLQLSRRRDLPARHRSLRATLEWSHGLLSPEQQELFAGLAAFRGGFTPEAAAAVCGPEAEWGGLIALQEHSLLIAERGPDGGIERYRFFEAVREFAAEQLRASGMEAERGRAHFAYFADLVARSRPELHGPEQAFWLDRLDRDRANLHAALDHSAARWQDATAPEPAAVAETLRLAADLGEFWRARSHLGEGRARLAALLAHPHARLTPEAPRVLIEARAAATLRSGTLDFLSGDYKAADSRLHEAEALARAVGNSEWEAAALQNLGNIAFYEQEYDEARELYERSLLLRRANGAGGTAIAAALHSLGNVAMRQDDLEGATRLFDESLHLRLACGDRLAAAFTQGALGQVAHKRGDVAAAARHTAAAMRTFHEMGTLWPIALALTLFSEIAEESGDWERAATLFAAAARLREANSFAVPPAEMPRHEQRRAEMRSRLGEDSFAASWRRGEAMSLEAAIGYATGSAASEGSVLAAAA